MELLALQAIVLLWSRWAEITGGIGMVALQLLVVKLEGPLLRLNGLGSLVSHSLPADHLL